MVLTGFSTSTSTPTITSYKDGVHGATESLATSSARGVLQTDKTLQHEKYYYAVGARGELHATTQVHLLQVQYLEYTGVGPKLGRLR